MFKAIRPSTARSTAKWLALIVAVAFALIRLNSAMFSAWMAGGPPNPYPEAWAQRALAQLCFAGAFVVGGVALFRQIGVLPRVDRLALILVAFAVSLVAVPHVREFFAVDRCLDLGGQWNGVIFACER